MRAVMYMAVCLAQILQFEAIRPRRNNLGHLYGIYRVSQKHFIAYPLELCLKERQIKEHIMSNKNSLF